MILQQLKSMSVHVWGGYCDIVANALRCVHVSVVFYVAPPVHLQHHVPYLLRLDYVVTEEVLDQ